MSTGDPGPPPYRGPLQGLSELSELLGGESPGSRRFLRGLALGAIVGAAIAGSRLWARRNHRESGDSHARRPDEERT